MTRGQHLSPDDNLYRIPPLLTRSQYPQSDHLLSIQDSCSLSGRKTPMPRSKDLQHIEAKTEIVEDQGHRVSNHDVKLGLGRSESLQFNVCNYGLFFN